VDAEARGIAVICGTQVCVIARLETTIEAFPAGTDAVERTRVVRLAGKEIGRLDGAEAVQAPSKTGALPSEGSEAVLVGRALADRFLLVGLDILGVVVAAAGLGGPAASGEQHRQCHVAEEQTGEIRGSDD
jgi:hypothetical protein